MNQMEYKIGRLIDGLDEQKSLKLSIASLVLFYFTFSYKFSYAFLNSEVRPEILTEVLTPLEITLYIILDFTMTGI